ncbi:MAG: succinate dehydrogenase assembly factor 2 [Pseudomonadota bacterium]|nr:succinate dehydrogenase assembly factor 2 [Pseudomonadota bacterium]
MTKGTLELARERARWRSRRGLLELDLLLEKFLARRLDTLDEEGLQAYDALLLLPDNELLDIAMGRKPAPDERTGAIIALLHAPWAPAA